MAIIDNLLARYSIISDQVDREDIRIILGHLEHVLQRGVAGDVVELGCYVGTTSLFIRRFLDAYGEKRTFHVYDSFQGLPAKSREDTSPAGVDFQAGSLTIGKKQFVQEFQKAKLKLPVIHKGWFHDLRAEDMPTHIAFAFLDGDFYSSIRQSLQLVLPLMSPGGVLVIDDYVREALPGVARAVADEGLRPQIEHGLGVLRT